MKYFKKSGFSKVLLTTMATLCLSQVPVSTYAHYSMNWRLAEVEVEPNSNKLTLQCRYLTGHQASTPTIYVYAKSKLIGSGKCATGAYKYTTIKIEKQKPGTPINLKASWVDKYKGFNGKGPISPTYGQTFTSWYGTAVLKEFNKKFTIDKTTTTSTIITIKGKGEPGAMIIASNESAGTIKTTTVDSKGNYTLKYPKQYASKTLYMSQHKTGYVTVAQKIKAPK